LILTKLHSVNFLATAPAAQVIADVLILLLRHLSTVSHELWLANVWS